MELTNLFCACGCGRELSNTRARTSKYIKGHYHKMCMTTPTERQALEKERKKIRSNEKFMKVYKRLVHIEYVLFKKPKRKKQKTLAEQMKPYSDGCKFCRKYDDNDIKCVMCFENNEKRPELCPKEK